MFILCQAYTYVPKVHKLVTSLLKAVFITEFVVAAVRKVNLTQQLCPLMNKNPQNSVRIPPVLNTQSCCWETSMRLSHTCKHNSYRWHRNIMKINYISRLDKKEAFWTRSMVSLNIAVCPHSCFLLTKKTPLSQITSTCFSGNNWRRRTSFSIFK